MEDEEPGTRLVKLFQPDKRRNNSIHTNKYTWYNFIPKNLWEQFSQLGNLYFLLVAVGQLFPSISNTKGKPATLVPLSGVILMQAVKDLFEDWQRVQSDQKENAREAMAVDLSLQESAVNWGRLTPGTVLKIRNQELFPADCLLLGSCNDDGHCFVETANLDGETNLKKKVAALSAAEFQEAVRNCRAIGPGAAPSLCCEGPSGDLYSFRSSMCLPCGEERGLGVGSLLLRGTSLQQTDWVYCMVVYAGLETRSLKNSRSARYKPSALDGTLNGVVALIFGMQIAVCFAISIASVFWQGLHGHQVWYLEGLPRYLNPFQQVGIWFLMLNSVVPISLMITVTVVKFAQGNMMAQDEGCGSNGKKAQVHTSQVIDSLGKVTHVFSDKTGTLTQNFMEYKACSVGGTVYGLEGLRRNVLTDAHVCLDASTLLGHLKSGGKQAEKLTSFFLCHALCHTVEPVISAADVPYNASSPDELALVCAARALGLEFLGISESQMQLAVKSEVFKLLLAPWGWKDGNLSAELLEVCEFDNNRKRMSVVVRLNSCITLFVKGADSSVLPHVADECDSRICEDHLLTFARQGLRTLCLAERMLTEEEYQDWCKRYSAAKALITEDKADKIHELCIEIETSRPCRLLGATAIDDKLQDEVPETIEQLRLAGVRVWVLTGDKVDTAISIAMSCKLLTEAMDNFVIDNNTEDQLTDILNAALEAENPALTIAGSRLAEAMECPESRAQLFRVGQRCRSVVCCRVSPKQKADVVDLVKTMDNSAVTLSIGDGANDVSMIVAAHVGVGLSGKEGAQAAYAADFALPEFRLLRRSVFGHGREAYRRNAVICIYSFYKNQVNVLITILAAAGNAFSGANVVNPWLMQCFNIVHCHTPIIIYGMYDRSSDLSDLEREPNGHSPHLFGFDIQLMWMLTALLQAIIVTGGWSTIGGMAGSSGPDLSHTSLLGNLCFASIVLCVNVVLMFRQNSWPKSIIACYVGNGIGLVVTMMICVPSLSQVLTGGNWIRVGPEDFAGSVVSSASQPLRPLPEPLERKRRMSLGYAFSEECCLERERDSWSFKSRGSCLAGPKLSLSHISHMSESSREPQNIELSSLQAA
ncbi:unnamed protein product [Effrenium voratum]|nr:unnamed protein product [Effrenium voratum]